MFLWADVVPAVKARWRLEILIFATVVLLVGIWTAMSPKGYSAQASLLFDDRSIEPGQSTQAQQDTTAALMSTVADVIQSDSLAADVSRRLQFDQSPAYIDRWRAATRGATDINAWIGRSLRSGLDVLPDKGSRVLTIQYTSVDPALSAEVANGFAQSYVEARLKSRTDPARTYAQWYRDRTQDVRSKLEQAQSKLSAFQKQTGIVDSETFNAENNRLTALASELAAAEGSAADSGARAGTSASQSPEVQGSGVVQGLRAQIAQKTAALSEMSAQLGPNHPDRIAASAELEALRSKLSAEIGNATSSIEVASHSANAKEADLRQRVDAQRARMLSLSNAQNQFSVLQHDVDSARAAYDAVNMKLGDMRLQSEAPTTNVTQLDKAVAPSFPAKPNIPLRILLSVVLGSMLAIGATLGLEIWRPLVRSESSLATWTGAPVIGHLDFSHLRTLANANEAAVS
jgi:succinoglycan biosynthesis transport protein ExoP